MKIEPKYPCLLKTMQAIEKRNPAARYSPHLLDHYNNFVSVQGNIMYVDRNYSPPTVRLLSRKELQMHTLNLNDDEVDRIIEAVKIDLRRYEKWATRNCWNNHVSNYISFPVDKKAPILGVPMPLASVSYEKIEGAMVYGAGRKIEPVHLYSSKFYPYRFMAELRLLMNNNAEKIDEIANLFASIFGHMKKHYVIYGEESDVKRVMAFLNRICGVYMQPLFFCGDTSVEGNLPRWFEHQRCGGLAFSARNYCDINLLRTINQAKLKAIVEGSMITMRASYSLDGKFRFENRIPIVYGTTCIEEKDYCHRTLKFEVIHVPTCSFTPEQKAELEDLSSYDGMNQEEIDGEAQWILKCFTTYGIKMALNGKKGRKHTLKELSVGEFIVNCCREKSDVNIPTEELFEHYNAYVSETHSGTGVNRTTFGKDLKGIGYKIKRPHPTKYDNRHYVYGVEFDEKKYQEAISQNRLPAVPVDFDKYIEEVTTAVPWETADGKVVLHDCIL